MEYEVTKIDDSTWILSEGFVRFFLLVGRDQALLIDTGMNVGKALDAARELTALPVQLINTHADPDHTGGNKDFDKVMMHEEETANYKGSGVVVPVKDGDKLDLGGRVLKVVWIPGHTPGSIGILDIERRMFFSGDTVQEHSEIFMFGPQRNLSRFAESLEKLAGMSNQFDVIYPCHGDLAIKPDVIPKLLEGAKKVLAGQVEGTPRQMFGTTIHACDVGVDILLVE